MRKYYKGILGAALRGMALAGAVVALWLAAAVTDFPAACQALHQQASAHGVQLLSRQLRVPAQAEEEAAATRLLLRAVPLLAQGQDGVQLLRRQRQQAQETPPPAEDTDDVEQPDLQLPQNLDGVISMTAAGKEGAQYLSRDGLYLYNRSGLELTPDVMDEGTVQLSLGEGPQILIYHTHGSEAYHQSDGDLYTQSDPYRTTDCTHNVVQVGEEMARVFREHGFQVIHDTNLYDYPAYSGAYERSGAAVRRWLAEYPTIRVALDVHRDALVGSDGSVYKLISPENGQQAAQVMLVVGTGHSGWKDNLALAVDIQRELLADYVSLARPTVLRSGKYNQDCLPGSLLVEVGGHGNTLTEALVGAHLFAQSMSQVLLGSA